MDGKNPFWRFGEALRENLSRHADNKRYNHILNI